MRTTPILAVVHVKDKHIYYITIVIVYRTGLLAASYNNATFRSSTLSNVESDEWFWLGAVDKTVGLDRAVKPVVILRLDGKLWKYIVLTFHRYSNTVKQFVLWRVLNIFLAGESRCSLLGIDNGHVFGSAVASYQQWVHILVLFDWFSAFCMLIPQFINIKCGSGPSLCPYCSVTVPSAL